MRAEDLCIIEDRMTGKELQQQSYYEMLFTIFYISALKYRAWKKIGRVSNPNIDGQICYRHKSLVRQYM